MKKVICLISLLFIFCSAFVTGVSFAASELSERLLDNSTKAYALTASKTLFVDKFNHQLQVIDLNTKTVVWSKSLPVIYDSKVLMNPLKIVVITAESNRLKKITLSAEGNVLSREVFPKLNIKENQSIAWSQASTGQKERLAIVDQQQAYIYQYPWNKPISIINYHLSSDKKYESSIVEDVQLQSPYVIIKVRGDSLTQSQDLYRVVNVSSRQIYTLPMQWNTNSACTIENSKLVVNTSSIVGNPLGLDTTIDHIIYAEYNLKTGTMDKKITRRFTTTDSNWKSDYLNRQIMLIDSERNQLSILNKEGQQLQVTNSSSKELTYRFAGSNNDKIYTLRFVTNGKAELIVHP